MRSLQKNYKNSPRNDFIFQKIFAKKGNEEMLTEILEEVLGIKINKIEIEREVTLERSWRRKIWKNRYKSNNKWRRYSKLWNAGRR